MNGSEFPSPLDLTSRRVPVMKRGQQGSPVWNWCNHPRHWRTIALPQLSDLGRSHGSARGPKLLPLFISDRGGHSYITDLIRKISQTHTPRDLNQTFRMLWVNKPDDKEHRCWGKAEQSVESLLSVCSFLYLQSIKCNSLSFSFNLKHFVYHHQSSLCCIWRNGPPFTYAGTSTHTQFTLQRMKNFLLFLAPDSTSLFHCMCLLLFDSSVTTYRRLEYFWSPNAGLKLAVEIWKNTKNRGRERVNGGGQLKAEFVLIKYEMEPSVARFLQPSESFMYQYRMCHETSGS